MHSNEPRINSEPHRPDAFAKAQDAIGQPKQEPLQIDAAMDNLREAVEQCGETVRALLRRLEPVLATSGDLIVTGSITANKIEISGTGHVTGYGLTGGYVGPSLNAPMTTAINNKRFDIEALTREVQGAIRLLQV